MQKTDVIGLGCVLVDELTILPHFPNVDTKVEIIKSQKQLGGPVPTALKALSSLGVKTSLISKIGDDTNAEFIKNELKSTNIDTSFLINEKGSISGHAQAWIDSQNASRTIAYSAGTLSPIQKKEIGFTKLPECRILHIDGRNFNISNKIIEHIKSKGSLISIDTGSFRQETLELLSQVDIAIMPKSFANKFAGEDSLVNLIEKTRKSFPSPKAIIITDGKNGSICSYQGGIITQKSFEINAFDTTGAGDIHSAGIIFGVLQNWNIEKILEFAAAFAALKCQHLGNKTIANYAQVADFIKEYNDVISS